MKIHLHESLQIGLFDCNTRDFPLGQSFCIPEPCMCLTCRNSLHQGKHVTQEEETTSKRWWTTSAEDGHGGGQQDKVYQFILEDCFNIFPLKELHGGLWVWTRKIMQTTTTHGHDIDVGGWFHLEYYIMCTCATGRNNTCQS